MNLVKGKIISLEESLEVVENLPEEIYTTLSKERFQLGELIDACDKLAEFISVEEHLAYLLNLGIPEGLAVEYIKAAKLLLSRSYLEHKVAIELGPHQLDEYIYIPPFSLEPVTEKSVPLGVLFHIAAGNMEGLPVMTVIEGLLTGNINILKLPSEEGGLAVLMLQKLIELEPKLTDYIYVFDYSSKDTELIAKLAAISDGIVVWGGDEAIKAVRRLATPSTKIIEWGHKISFAYVGNISVSDEELKKLAKGICKSNQLFCSSCQGIYIDTGDYESVVAFAKRFLAILDAESALTFENIPLSIKGLTGLKVYNEELEALNKKAKVLRGRFASVIIYPDNKLVSSLLYRNVWIKPLLRKNLINVLKPYKSYLQTVALITLKEDREILQELLIKAGIERITSGNQMSNQYCGEPHDGVYSLKSYTKLVVIK